MKVSVVVPSFNHARFLRANLDSILSQEYADLQVLVFDGGSTDETVSILETYKDRIEYVSQRDDGQADAINQGLQKSSGEILAYLNSDDVYYPNTFNVVSQYFETHPDCLALYGEAYHLYEDGSIMERYYTEPWSYPRLFQLCYLCQPAVFWRREVMERFGVFDATLQLAMDYDYWLRVGREIEFHYLEGCYLAGSRLHQETKTLSQRVKVHQEILEVVLSHCSVPPDKWLLALAEVTVDAEQRNAGGTMDESLRRARFAKWVLHHADREHIPLRPSMVEYLEQTLIGVRGG